MKISIVTLFPELYRSFLSTSLVGRAQSQHNVAFNLVDIFSYVAPKERLDAPTFGHGAGVLLRPQIVQTAIEEQEQKLGRAFRIFFSPQGKKMDQDVLQEIHKHVQNDGHILLFPARYEGMDARVEDRYADALLSAGDVVLMGGDIPAMMFVEGFLRLIPGVVGKQESVLHESFSGPFLDYPEYTEPVVWQDREVPAVVRSGNHKALQKWRREQAIEKTVLHHFDWLRSHAVEESDIVDTIPALPPHYAVLMHSNVLLPDDQEGTTSVTSFDIHDIARSACTYGIKQYFIVTPLVDQQRVVQRLLDFWQKGAGIAYNRQRHEAVKLVQLVASLDEVIEYIELHEGKKPVLLGTSARISEDEKLITYDDQELVWKKKSPVLFMFGTGRGLSPHILNRCDFILAPLRGFSLFNHLSVRSAAAVIFDRWLGVTIKKRALYSQKSVLKNFTKEINEDTHES